MPPPPPTNPITPQVPTSLSEYNVPLSTYLIKTQKYSSLAVGALIFQSPTPTSEPRILLLKRAESDYLPGIWEMPGGAVDAEDPSILAGCAREVWEESGLRVSEFKEVIRPGNDGSGAWEWEDRGKWWGKVCFLVDVEGDAEVKLDPEEHQAFGWFTRKEVRGLDLWFKENGEAVENAFRVVGDEGVKDA